MLAAVHQLSLMQCQDLWLYTGWHLPRKKVGVCTNCLSKLDIAMEIFTKEPKAFSHVTIKIKNIRRTFPKPCY